MDSSQKEYTSHAVVLAEDHFEKETKKPEEEKKVPKSVRGDFDGVFNVKEPSGAVNGISSGIGNIVKGGVAGVTSFGACTYYGAKWLSWSRSWSGTTKGAVQGACVGLFIGSFLAIYGCATGLNQMRKGIQNQP